MFLCVYFMLLCSFQIFKAKVQPKQVDIESLNQQASELAKDCTADQAAVVKEPLNALNLRWDALQDIISDREVSVILNNGNMIGKFV